MSKRFIDTGLFNDSWFMDLSMSAKILWVYLITQCDHAGIIEINNKLLKTQTDIKNFETVSKELGNRLVRLTEQYYFVPKFLKFQYPDFPKSTVKQQLSAIKRLREFNLIDESTLTLKEELDNSYGNGNGNGNGNEPEEREKTTPKSDSLFEKFWEYYPKKLGRGKAEEAFNKIKPSQELLNKMVAAIKEQKTSSQWQKEDGQFIPYPATWLNQKRWGDEVDGNGKNPSFLPTSDTMKEILNRKN